MPSLTFTGPWDKPETIEVTHLLEKVFDEYPGVTIECYYRLTGVPYKAYVEYQGRYSGPAAYGHTFLVDNIINCLPVTANSLKWQKGK